ncbi:MATE efflux family [Lecanosticta acicola]|uniref:MATE efflux family n=1 Tax=Lecanosticta acicola TaxID=111012 RepID=A0AAI9E8T5_9PEZI|nr:MATE efflux family [Lecanosticta acicola]
MTERAAGQHASETDSLLGGQRDVEAKQNEKLSLKAETIIMLQYSGPLVLTHLLQYVFSLIIILVASQLSTDELAGVSLGSTTANILGYAVFEGMATALDTLCSQAFGASAFTDVGMHTIRFTIFIHLVAIPIGLLWFFSEELLLLVNVPSLAVAQNAGVFLRCSLIGIPGYASFEAGKRFMQAQGNFTAGFYVLLLCLPISAGLTWILVYTANMRVAGAALAASLTNLLRPLLLAAYARFIDRSTLQCWPSAKELKASWTKEWKPMISLAISGVLMSLCEWLCYEILTFCTTYVGAASLAAQTFLGTSAVLVWHIAFSASVACSTRIGQLIGAGRSNAIAELMKWYGYAFIIIGLIDAALGVGITVLMLETLVHDEEVAELLKLNLPYLAMFVFFEATSNWPHGIVRGIGWQSIGAWVTLTINYLYAVPLSIFLELYGPHLGIRGLWIGLGSGLGIITVVETVVVWLRLRKNDDLAACLSTETVADIDGEQ